MSVPAAPYTALAQAYDATIGWPVFLRTRDVFEAMVRRFCLHFRDALDLGCGTGLFCRYLALRWGIPVTGVDLSPAMLSVASRNCEGLPVRLLQADISQFRLPLRTDLVTCNFDTLNHLTRPCGARQMIARAAAHLRPRGKFFFDFLTPCPGFPPGRPVRLDAISRNWRLTQILEWRKPELLLAVKVILQRPGFAPRIESHVERLFQPAVVLEWLAESGLCTVCASDAEFGGSLKPPASAARIFVLAVKA
ncbi:MAG: class I SAM-dependent methyltransferase [Bryobacteraceae bacterium]|nr:class I SAM-dependent methyltransferase [Bryobacteraceae bacterium]